MVGGSWVSGKSGDASKQSRFHPVPKAAFGGGEAGDIRQGFSKSHPGRVIRAWANYSLGGGWKFVK